ncbi:MAG TPA: 23S rRNA (uracil(1939)-C(5))-methyltransferase RlmD [Bacteroidales bacterium]|nr:23S rRNA (uracil(1939)-C(5))-methyltransferase RlmD [Bacteroidales bacterium]
MGRKRKHPLIEKLEIIDIAAEGKAIGKYNNQVVFVPWLAPGDVADVQVVRKKKKFMEARVEKIHEHSSLRQHPFCKHFTICGGCKWQHLPYGHQLKFKQKQVVDNLTRIGKVELKNISKIKPSLKEKYYRNKLEFTFSATRWLTDDEVEKKEDITDRNALGFHVPGRFDRVLDIEKCYLQDDLSNQIRLAVREFAIKEEFSFYHQRANEGLLRNLIIRNSNLGEWMVIMVFGEERPNDIESFMYYIKDLFPQITSLQYVVNTKVNDTIGDLDIVLFDGREYILEEMEGLQFKIGAKSFFQTNSDQALELYKIARNFAQLNKTDLVYDLYTGTGTIANFVAKQCKQVIGVEYVEPAIVDARINAENNGNDNTLFFAGDMKDVLDDDFIALHGKPNVLITDPPRAGMHPDVVKTILRAEPDRIVYVSCNPATQARDLELLSEKYEVTAVQPVDMFPHTHHVENVVRLDKK